MKKIIPLLLIVAALLAFVSCKAEPESFTVKFDLNGGDSIKRYRRSDSQERRKGG